jgi:predicted Rossmann-fold nucleotide-binding protein
VTPKPGYPNEFVELAIHTHLPYSGLQGTHDLSRNHINVLSCRAIIALPGEHGTASEVSLALQYEKPVVAYASDNQLLTDFPASVPRLHSTDTLREFVRRACR